MDIQSRYSLITRKFPREFLLLQGTGCIWRRCRFCDYYDDVSPDPHAVNAQVLKRVTGQFGTLDVINSGSAPEMDEATLRDIAAVIRAKNIHTLWLESHWLYHDKLAEFARQFAPATVKFRCGVETFNPNLRKWLDKGIPESVGAEKFARYFRGVCLLVGFVGEDRRTILEDIRIAHENFEYYNVNLFCENRTEMRRDPALAEWLVREVVPSLQEDPKAEVLVDNTDLGVG